MPEYELKPRRRQFATLPADDLGAAAVGTLARWFQACQRGSDDSAGDCLDRLFALAHEIQLRSDAGDPNPPEPNIRIVWHGPLDT